MNRCVAFNDRAQPDQTLRTGRQVREIHQNALDLFNAGKDGEANSYLDSQRAFLDQSPDHWTYLGSLLRGARRHEEAVSAFKNALKLDPNSSQAYFGMGQVAYCVRNYDLAIAAYGKALSIAPQNHTYQYYLARTHVIRGDSESAKPLARALINNTDERQKPTVQALFAHVFHRDKPLPTTDFMRSGDVQAFLENLTTLRADIDRTYDAEARFKRNPIFDNDHALTRPADRLTITVAGSGYKPK